MGIYFVQIVVVFLILFPAMGMESYFSNVEGVIDKNR